MRSPLSALLPSLFFLTEFSQAQSNSTSGNNLTVQIPYQYTYLLPDGFSGDVNSTFVNGTTTDNSTVNNLFSAAKNAPFVSYDDGFLDIIGPNPNITLIAQRDNEFAYEMGVWVPENNEVWFTSSVGQGMIYPPTLYSLNLETHAINLVNTTPPIINANGGYYYNGTVYIATYLNNGTYRGGVVAVDPKTLELTTITNSYFGLPYNGIDDVCWTTNGTHSYMFYTDLQFASAAYSNLPPEQLPAAVYRWDPQLSVVSAVIPRGEVDPNGVRVSPDMKTLYVTDSSAIPPYGPSHDSWLGPYIYAYDLNENSLPVNRRLFGQVREWLADGIHCDDDGNVWTAEGEGIVVRNPMGKVLGVFNAQYFLEDKSETATKIANFALANDTVIVEATTRLYTVKVGKVLVSSDSPIVN